ncbi:hypothetical protein AVEN_133380-1, partial [Araneus ventricosus]
ALTDRAYQKECKAFMADTSDGY